MDQPSENQRLSRIATRWSLVCKAHGGPAAQVREAQLELLRRYGGAIDRYLLGALRNAEAAEELSQEFALRFIRGDFHGVDPQRGRFRDYVKAVLFRLVVHYFKRRQESPRPLPADLAAPSVPGLHDEDTDRSFLDSWRSELLDRAWAALEELQRTKGQPFFTVLHLYLDQPQTEITSAQMALQLSSKLDRPYSAANVRKILQRARERFAEFLLNDVEHSLDDPTPEELLQELRDLGFLSYCRPVLEDRGWIV
jgi:RNA polymerase sigma-70 factor (ECF subfamily)